MMSRCTKMLCVAVLFSVVQAAIDVSDAASTEMSSRKPFWTPDLHKAGCERNFDAQHCQIVVLAPLHSSIVDLCDEKWPTEKSGGKNSPRKLQCIAISEDARVKSLRKEVLAMAQDSASTQETVLSRCKELSEARSIEPSQNGFCQHQQDCKFLYQGFAKSSSAKKFKEYCWGLTEPAKWRCLALRKQLMLLSKQEVSVSLGSMMSMSSLMKLDAASFLASEECKKVGEE
eukprot:TRINITY_DN66302_c0_g1_i1.p1 TRINITY_DN66302_c0_g1~~TRINITY_DN66302_c0_g1_i1.p1  ORF type:complete len:230 (+),score=48.11 TRINITY_DN66302_c0_g1_i1:53-742(+)